MNTNSISSKDLSYLSDMFEWNMTTFKNITSALLNIQDNDIKNTLENVNKNLISNMEEIINILQECLNELNG